MRGPGKVLGQGKQQVLVKYGNSYVRVHPCRLALEHNHDKTDNKVSPTLTPNGSIQEQAKERHCRTFDEDGDEELGSQEEQNNDRERNMVSNSMERLKYVRTSRITTNSNWKERRPTKKNMKVQIISNNTHQWNTTTLFSRSGKPTGKYSKAWNSELPDESVKSKDFERDVTMLKKISDPIAIERARKDAPEKIQYTHIYLSEIEQNKSDTKLAELENLKSQGVYTEK